MHESIKKLIEDGKWRDISESPRNESWFLAKETPDEHYYAACFYGFADEDNMEPTWQAKCGQPVVTCPEPTHFRALPDDRLAIALQVAVEALEKYSGLAPHTIASEALATIQQIAEGE